MIDLIVQSKRSTSIAEFTQRKLRRAAFLLLLLLAGVAAAHPPGDIPRPHEGRVTITIVSGDSQVGPPGELLREPIVVQVTNEMGEPVVGTALAFRIAQGGGASNDTTAVTDDAGCASVQWTIGHGLLQTMEVSLADERFNAVTAVVTAINERWVHLSIVSGNDQIGFQGEQLRVPLVFSLTDSYGNPVPAVDVHFEITAGGGRVAPTAARTSEEGLVELRATLGTGAYQRIRASVAHEYWVAKYRFTYAEAQSVTSTADARWTSGVEFVDGAGDVLRHDGRILETEHFLIFSDGSSDTVKVQYANMAEESLAELLDAFDISGAEELGVYSDRRETKMTIFCFAGRVLDSHAFAYGFVLPDINHPGWDASWEPRRRMNYRNTVKHELMHVVQYLLGGREGSADSEAWFDEGLAEHVGGGDFYHIETLTQMSDWRRNELHVNPTTIRTYWNEIPRGADPGRYYPMFALAVEYLLDAKGHGRSLVDVKRMLLDLTRGSTFQSAFETHMGISVDSYRSRFYERMERFLAIY